MTRTTRLAALASTAALLVTPALSLAAKPATLPSQSGNPGTSHVPATPGPGASPSSKAKAYGKYCQTQSKKHVAGQKGTPFSQCVTAMAKLAHGDTTSAQTACKSMSKKHVAGQSQSAYSKCVSGAAKLKHDQQS